MSDRAALRDAARAIRIGSKSFAVAARLFDHRTRESALLLYAWCRHCDDVIDGQAYGHAGTGPDVDHEAARRLAELETRTRMALSGDDPGHPVFTGLAAVMRRHDVPERHAFAHLAGFRMDVEGRRYLGFEETLDYAYHVAGVVGVMMGHVMGVRDAATLERASDLGIAFQLTNMARDLVDDAACGRCYLPADWLDEAGLRDEALGDPRHREALAGLARRLVARAEPYYASAALGIRALPPRSAWAVAAALGIYRQIGCMVVERGARAWDRRVSTSPGAKLRHVLAGAGAGIRASLPRPDPSARRGGIYGRAP